MKNLLTAVLGIVCLALFSCQKEVDDIFSNNGNGGGASELLTKMIAKDGSDSTVYLYSYNNAKQIIGINTTEVSSGTTTTTTETIVRNGQGIIQKIIIKSPDLAQFGIDSLVNLINYDAGSRHYTNRIFKLSILGITISDSTVYGYDAAGKIAVMTDYLDDGSGNPQDSKFEFAYTGANMTHMKLYDLSSGTPDLQLTEVFEYDAKPSPLVLGNEALLLNNALQWISANNMTKNSTTLAGDPTVYLALFNHTYNASNKPVSTNIISDGQPAGTMSYFYN